MGFRLVDHTADLALAIEAESREALYGEALRALSAAMVGVESLRPAGRRTLVAEAPDAELLLADLLNEALGRFEIAGELYLGAAVRLTERAGSIRVEADAAFDRYDARRHRVRTPIKGVTYHGLEVGACDGAWHARLVLDL